MNRFIIAAFLVSPLLLIANPNDSIYYKQMLELQASHINANVPDSNKFDEYLKRDIKSYFKVNLKKEVDVDYELLRKGPTQSGVAYPKFYLWIKVIYKNKIINEGALRVVAIEKIKFEITDFLSKKDIIKNEEEVSNIFPMPLVEGIKIKANNK